ncbi:sensor histidine kinase [Nocardiopsis oceani]
MHKPVHPHSQTPGRTSDGEDTPATEPPTGPFSASAENGYRPASRVSVPNPYTTRGLDVDDVDTGANPVGQWRGVGLDEPEPRSPHTPATTDTMTDTPSSPEPAARPEAPLSPPAQSAPTADQGPSAGQHAFGEPRWPAPEPAAPPEAALPEPPQPEPPQPEPPQPEPAPHQQWTPPAHAQQGYQEQQGHYQGPPGYGAQPGPQGPPAPQAPHGQQGYPGYQGPSAGSPPPRGYQQHGGYPQPEPHHPAPHQAPPQHPGQYPPQQYPPQQYAPQQYAPQPYPQPQQQPPQPQPYAPPPAPHYPAPYPQAQPLVAYQNAYPAPYQPPGYVLPGQPVVYPHQLNPYGQPVQHVIVLAPGQQPQVVTAESAATLFAERTEPATTEEVRQNRALTRSEPATEEPGAEEEAESPTVTEGPAKDARIPEADEAARTESTAQEAQKEGSAAVGTADSTRAEPTSTASHGPQSDILNEALAGLAMRDLSLVDALLEMVEELETGAQDPDILDKLFQIDNFATRMRRNGENFLVLTGHDGGESDAHDEIVPLLDVARAATSEIKDYPRVTLGKLPQTSITGLAADDISHLLAELLDNATANSPEHSQVVISAQELDDGRLMIVVEDEGVGIPDAQLTELNGRLGGEPVLDDEVPRHMGLYVASRIARKHGLETRLESRSFRGVSAYTIVPKGLLRVATPKQPGHSRTSTTPSASAPVAPTGPIPPQSANGKGAEGADGPGGPKPSPGGTSAVTSAGLPRRSATPHGSPLRMMPHPGALSDNPPPPPKGREDTPPKLTGEARAEQIRDEIGDFLDGERAALEGEDIEGDKE